MSSHERRAADHRSNNFDFLRLLLSMLVLYSHCFPLAIGTEANEPFRVLTRGQMTGGAVAVDLFFVMSGYLITASAVRSSSLRSFFSKRILRIYPAFVVAALLDVLVVLPLSGGILTGSGTFHRFASFVLATLRLREFQYDHAFAANPYAGSINGSLWSIQFEFWCYIGVALLLLSGLLKRRRVVLGLFLFSIALSTMFVVRGWIFGGKWLGVLLGSPQLWARLLPLYLAGVVAYLFRDRVPLHWTGAVGSFCLLAAACFLPWGYALLFPIAGTYLVFYVAFSSSVRLYDFGRHGDFSYGAYLFAFPIMQLLMQLFGRPVSVLRLFCTAAPLTLLAAVASWYGVERHFVLASRGRPPVAS